MCAPNAPPAPDYTQAAREQGAANIEAAQVQGQINNPNVVSPYGTQTVTWGQGLNEPAYQEAMSNYQTALSRYNDSGGIDGMRGTAKRSITLPKPIAPKARDYTLGNANQPTLTQAFSPEQQAIFDESNAAKLSLSQLASRGAGVAGDVVGKNLDFSGLPAAPASGGVNQRVIDAMMGRVNEDYGRATDDANSQLIAAGLRPGGKGYDDRMQLLQRGKNDAAQQAVLAGYQQGGVEFNQDTQARRNALAEYLQERQSPLNEITALMSGSQVQNPFATPQYGQSGQVAPAPLFGAMQQGANYNTDLYNAQAGAAAGQQSGLFGLGGTGLMVGAMM
jgi:hypothetical protein